MAGSKSNWRYRAALWVDRWAGPLLCALLLPFKALSRRLRPGGGGPPRKVLVLKMWGMGSILLTAPLIRQIRARHPEARIDFVTLTENLPALRLLDLPGQPVLVDLSGGIGAFLRDTVRTLWRIRRERYDLLLDLEFFTRFSAIFSVLAGAGHTRGFSAKGTLRGRLHDTEMPFNTYHHVVLNFLSLLRDSPVEPLPEVDLGGPDALPRVHPDPEALASLAEKLRRDPGWREDRPSVAVNPNAGEMALERRWPEDRVVELVQALRDSGAVNVVLTGSPSERAFVERIVSESRSDGQVVNLAGEIDIAELVALYSRVAAVVTNDSGPMHIAAAAGASTVALFGPETPVLYAPLRSRPEQQHVVHYRRMACSPCMFVHDNKVLSCWFADALCMRGISAKDVVASVQELVAKDAPR